MSNMEFSVGGIYSLDFVIGKGSFGVIYLGTNILSGERVAIKMELRSARNPRLPSEYKIYRVLAGGVGISRVHWFGRAGKYNALVLDILGPSLRDLLKFCGGKFTLKTVLMVADQLLTRIEYIHEKNFIHRDIKPANLVMGLNMSKLYQVYVIDFGMAKYYRHPKTRQHISCVKRNYLIGTSGYASIKAHHGIELSRRDDLESLGFALIHFALGRLPWQGIKAKHKKELHNKIGLKKVNTPIEILCSGLPKEFAIYFQYCRALVFEEKPAYNCLRRLFRKLFFSKGYYEDNLFDWAVLNKKYCPSSNKYENIDNFTQDYNSKETKKNSKGGEQPDRFTFIKSQCSYSIKVLQITSYI